MKLYLQEIAIFLARRGPSPMELRAEEGPASPRHACIDLLLVCSHESTLLFIRCCIGVNWRSRFWPRSLSVVICFVLEIYRLQLFRQAKGPLTMSVDGATAAVADMSLSDIERRNKVFDRLWAEQKAELERKEKPDIFITLQVNGKDSVLTAQAWQSTPASLIRHLDAADKSSLGEIVVAKIDGKQLWDLDRPLEFACKLSFVSFSSVEGRYVFWHSSAHVLGEACECVYSKCLLSHGPPVEQGFFYDMAIADG